MGPLVAAARDHEIDPIVQCVPHDREPCGLAIRNLDLRGDAERTEPVRFLLENVSRAHARRARRDRLHLGIAGRVRAGRVQQHDVAADALGQLGRLVRGETASRGEQAALAVQVDRQQETADVAHR